MIFAATMWLLMTLLLGGFCYSAVRTYTKSYWRHLAGLSFPLAAPLAALLILAGSGYSTPCIRGWTAPDGTYNVLGFNLVQDEKIDLLLDVPYGPRVCYIPWSVQDAKDLQDSEDGMQYIFGATSDGAQGEAGESSGEGGGGDKASRAAGLRDAPMNERPAKSQ